jgi:proteasome lid subunit RPN8/RPN11
VPDAIKIRAEVLAQMPAHARSCAAEECCGLLAGRGGVITRMFSATNVASDSATSYEIAPKELFQLMREIRAAGLDLLGIYHSHPTGVNEPSARDIELAYYPDAAYFIISPLPGAAEAVRAFTIRDGRACELHIQVI